MTKNNTLNFGSNSLDNDRYCHFNNYNKFNFGKTHRVMFVVIIILVMLLWSSEYSSKIVKVNVTTIYLVLFTNREGVMTRGQCVDWIGVGFCKTK